jgi:hypothetical protein
MRMRCLGLLVGCALLAVAACGADDDDAPVASPAATPTAPGSPPTVVGTVGDTVPLAPTSTRPPTGPIGSAEEAEAIADLAAREGVDESAITVVTVEKVDLRDGVVGCPETDAGTGGSAGPPRPSLRVVLELDGMRYEYFVGPTPRILCASPGRPLEG